MTEIKLKRRGIVYCEDCSYWDKSVIGHTQGGEDIGDRLCRRQMRWTTEMDYCSDGIAEQTEPSVIRKFIGYPCETCKHREEEWDREACEACCENNDHYEPTTEDCSMVDGMREATKEERASVRRWIEENQLTDCPWK